MKKIMKMRSCDLDIDAILDIDNDRRAVMRKTQDLQAKQNHLARQIGMIKSGKQDGALDELMKEAEEIKVSLVALESNDSSLQAKLEERLSFVPNILQDLVPDGKNEDDNVELKTFGKKPEFNFTPKEHHEIGHRMGFMDFTTSAKVSGSRFVFLKDRLARLERALKNFMLDVHTQEFGYQEVYVPHLVREAAMFGTGQLPKFDNGYQTTDGFYLIPTAEVPLTNMVFDSIVHEDDLPMRFVAYSQCFRSEAGAMGKDTSGMLRQHQFSKVELVSICTPERSSDEHERMLSAAESILQKLGLHYRVCLLCSGDTSFSASKTYDIEVWLPGQGKYREISSCSNTLDFQARRMKARYKDKAGKNHYLHTLNGSGLAVGRTMIAIMENYQNSDGSFSIPDALIPYMGGINTIK